MSHPLPLDRRGRTEIKLTFVYLSRDGTVSTGPIVLADVAFGPYTIKNQAISESIVG